MINLIKLAVGCDGIDQMKAFQAARLRASGQVFLTTRMTPKRVDELLDGGSLYWVIKGQVAVRQRIVAVDSDHDEEGRPCCRLTLDPELIEVEPRPSRPFQGWRYLEPDAAPRDRRPGETEPPPEMAEELRRLGLI
ncbi:MAG TPA: DUF1489 domain-containing protein [Magnetospirillum sp.]|nr:DUF1489 domain-containing protein [Magnetospirillum sp.]